MKNCTTQFHINLLKEGNEKGLDYFYKKYFNPFCFRVNRAIEDLCNAESIVQEAFFRLWLFRENITDSESIYKFLTKQTKTAIGNYFNKSRSRFHRNLLQLDAIENYQQFMLGYELETQEEEEDLIYLEQLEEEKKRQLDQLNKLIPHLTEQQQNFIRLCLEYSFNYERIAYYLGGISDYEVSMQVEKTIQALRNILNSQAKLNLIESSSSKLKIEGEFTEEQAEVLRMRYELQMSFEEISVSLKLNETRVKKLFIEARAKVKPSKKTA